MTPNPIARFARWFRDAQRADIDKPEAAALATADASARPSVRMVLLKGFDERGFVFYTDGGSRKGRELEENPYAALCFHWDPLGRQVRIEGAVTRVSSEESDAYWATRPRISRLSALASNQSRPLRTRAQLVERRRRLERKHKDEELRRKEEWGGYLIAPERIEFWQERKGRLHQRELFTRGQRGYRLTLLQP